MIILCYCIFDFILIQFVCFFEFSKPRLKYQIADRWVLCGLVKRWLHEIRSDREEQFQAIFLFKDTIFGSLKQMTCNLSAAASQIVDGFISCQVI